LEGNILGVGWAPIIKEIVFFGIFEAINNFKPLGYMDNSPQPSGQVSAPTFQQIQALSTFYKRNLNYTGTLGKLRCRKNIKIPSKLTGTIDDNNTF
jgi:hypothetical protein